MDNSTMLSMIIGLVFVGIIIYMLFLHPKNEARAVAQPPAGNSNALQLQAYERLTLLADRIALPNLISRTPSEGLSARDMQLLLTKLIREEFDYNVTQQIYVSPEAWNAVRNLKEKNLLTINQIGQLLPPEATGMDLQKQLLQYLVNEPKANLHELVSEALGFEARKLL
ncbi:MAG: hypothetical protein WAP48_01900 [Sediminibacterium sp.]